MTASSVVSLEAFETSVDFFGIFYFVVVVVLLIDVELLFVVEMD